MGWQWTDDDITGHDGRWHDGWRHDVVSIIGGYTIYRKPQSTTIWGIAILIASIVGLLTVGGFIIGPILGIVAGILALVKK